MSQITIAERSSKPTLAVVGGGLSGIAAAEAALRNGFQVALFERSRVLGGRAASMYEPITGQWIDNGQHIALGCCSELLALNERLGLTEFFAKRYSMPFAQTDGKHWRLAPSVFLPNRWKLLPAFLQLSVLSLRDRFATGFLMRELAKKEKPAAKTSTKSFLDKPFSGTFGDWLVLHRASANSIDKFWTPLIFSSLSETVENVCFNAVQKVVQDGFLAGSEAMTIHIPTVPLRTIYHDTVSVQLRHRGAELQLGKRVKRLCWELRPKPNDADEKTANAKNEETNGEPGVPHITALEFADGSTQSFDNYILAVPSFRLWEILSASDLEPYAEQLGLERFEPGAISTLHLWFNHRLLPPDCLHTALLGGPGQFLFCPRQQDETTTNTEGIYHTVVISASHRLLSESELSSRGSYAVVERVVEQLRTTFPKSFSNSSRLLHHRVTTYFDAVFSPNPKIYSNRPGQPTPFSNLALAGDWTQTNLPSTLEGAVRSGIRAVEVFQ